MERVISLLPCSDITPTILGQYHYKVKVVSPWLCMTDITLCMLYHRVIYTGYINYISPFLGIICYRICQALWDWEWEWNWVGNENPVPGVPSLKSHQHIKRNGA